MIVIVSGLPRSGTSLLMQMLAAGGYPILSDDERRADEHNPRGYFEYALVRHLDRDNHWLADAEGKALKVVSPLLYHLPPGFSYRVLFIQRSLEEVLLSQAKMLAHRGLSDATEEALMRRHFERHLHALESWLIQQPNFTRLSLAYSDVIAEPRRTAEQIAHFLQIELNLDRMTTIVDPTLHRQRLT